MRMFAVVVISCLLSLSWGQPSNVPRPPFSWEYEFSQRPNLYTPEVAVLDSHGVLWVLCSARMGNEGYDKQHVTHAMFRIDGNGQQLSTAELGLPLSNEERLETSEYRLSPLPSGEMGLMFNKIHYEGRGESYLGAYYAKLGINGALGPLREVGGAGPEYSELLTLTNGDLLLGGSEGALISFDSGGASRWKKSFRQPLLVNPSSANLSDGNICLSAWMLGSKGVLKKLRIMQLDQHGETRHVAGIDALRGQVAGGPRGSCAVLYDRAPNVYKGEYHLTVFDQSLSPQWTVPVPQTSASGAEFTVVPLAEGYLAQIGNTLIEFDWSGKELWTETENRGLVRTIVVPAKDGFFVVTKDLNMNNGFHVKRALTTNP